MELLEQRDSVQAVFLEAALRSQHSETRQKGQQYGRFEKRERENRMIIYAFGPLLSLVLLALHVSSRPLHVVVTNRDYSFLNVIDHGSDDQPPMVRVLSLSSRLQLIFFSESFVVVPPLPLP